MSSNNQTMSPDLIRDETLSHPPHEEPIQSFLNQFRRNSEHNSTNGSGTNSTKTLPPQSSNLLSLFSKANFVGPNTNQQTSSNLQTQPSLPNAAPGFNADKDASQNLLSLLTKNVISPSFPTQSSNIATTTTATNDSPKLQHQDSQNGISRNSIKSPEQLLEESSQTLKSLIVGQAPKSENDLSHYYQSISTSAVNGAQENPFAAFVKGFTKEKKQDSDNSFSASELASVSPQNIPLPATPQSEKSSRAISPKSFFAQSLSPNQQEKTASTPPTNITDLKGVLNIDLKEKDIGVSPFDNSNLFDLLENSTEISPPKAIPVNSNQRNIEIADQSGLESIPSAMDYLDNFTISQVTSEAELNFGQLVSSHCGLISYVMKSGKVRLIYEKDGYRTLLRDDKSQILDMKLRKYYSDEDIENGQNHRLVTLSQSNNFIIWDIKRNVSSDRGLEYSMVCKISGTPDDVEFSRVIFHPTNPSIIAVSCSNNQIIVFNTDTIPAGAANSTFNPSKLAHATTILSGLDDALTSICFSPDGSCVFAGTQTGVVGVWNWSNSPHPLMKIQTNTHLPIHYIQPCQPKSSRNQTTLLPASFIILGFNYNLHIHLWDMTSQQSIHAIHFRISNPITKKSVNTLNYDPSSETLFVGCSSRSSILLFNLNWVYDNLPLSRFNNSVEYSCPEHILSMDISPSANLKDPNSIVLYAMHGKTIQMYTIPGEQLLPGFDRSTLQPRVVSPSAANANTKSKQLIIAQSEKSTQQVLKDNTKPKMAQKAKKNSEPKVNSTQPSLSLLSMGDFKPVDAISEKLKVQAKEPQSKPIQVDKNEKSKQVPSPSIDSQKSDQLAKALAKSIDSINQNINYTLSTIVPTSIQRGVYESVDLSLERQLPNLMDKYFTGPDFQKYLNSMIQHHVNQAFKSDALVESITSSITSSVISGIQDAFQSSFTALLIPAYQKATQKMFTQMQSAFENGLNKNFEELQKLPSLYPGASMVSPSHLDHHPFPYPHQPPPSHPHAIPPHYPAPQHPPQNIPQAIPQSVPQNLSQSVSNEEENAITRFLKMNSNGAPPSNILSGTTQSIPFPSVNVNQPSPPITQPTTPPSQQSTSLDPNVKDKIMQAVSVKDIHSLLKIVSNQNIPLVFYACQFNQRDLLGLSKILAKDLSQQTGIRLQILQEAIRNIDSKDTSIISHLDHFLEFIYNQCNSFEKANPSTYTQWAQLPLIKSLILDIKKQ